MLLRLIFIIALTLAPSMALAASPKWNITGATCNILLSNSEIAGSPEVQDLPLTWKSIVGPNTTAHLRVAKFSNGLTYVTIHAEDGTEIYTDQEDGGPITCDCGKIHPKSVQMASVIRRIDLGDGFLLYRTLSVGSPGQEKISSMLGKEYLIGNTAVEIRYDVEPKKLRKNEVENLWMDYEAKSPEKSVHVRFEFKAGQHQSTQISLTDRDHYQMKFEFGREGKLESVLAIKKGQDRWVKYDRNSPETGVLFNFAFGRKISTFYRISSTITGKIIAATSKNAELDLQSILSFGN